MKKLIILLLIGVVIVVFALGFIELDNTDKDISSEGIVYSITNISNDLEKVTNLSKREEDIICATSKGLIMKDAQGKIIPSLAKEIEVRDEGIEYEFVLDDNIYWSNGEKITPEDIRDFFKELIKTEDQENILALLDVYGAKEFREGEGTFDKGVAITTGENSIKIRLNRKNEEFLENLTKPQYRIRQLLPVWRDIKNTYKSLSYSGSYKISSVTDNEIILSKNEKVEGPEKISFVKDENEELAMASFEVGKRDIVMNPPNSQLEKLNSENKLLTFPSQEGYYLWLNSEDNKLSLSSRREIYKNIYFASESFMDDNPQRVESAEGSYFREDKEDLTKLQTRKVSVNVNSKIEEMNSITLLAEDKDESRDLCKFLVGWFKEKLSINLKYSLVKEGDLNDMALIKRYDVVLLNLKGDSNEKKDFYKELEGLLGKKEKEILENEIKNNSKDFLNIEEKLFNDCIIVPIMFSNENIAKSKKVSSVFLDGNGNIDFSTIIEE